jgi:hypothetical protein
MRSRRLDPCVVDTNVAMVANGKSTAGARCTEACAKKLKEIVERGHVVIDDCFELLREYGANLNFNGQPGVGDHFYRWLFINQGNPARCTRVRITPTPEGSYTEFPQHPDLNGFDPSDHKFIAVAAAHPKSPCVLQAFDTKWWPLRHAFKASGIDITFLCPNEIKAKYHEKFGCGCS